MRRRHGVFAWITLCLLVLGCAGIAKAQVNTATLSGTVTDPQGLAVRGAKLTITSAATGAERTVESDEVGRYKVVGLPPGRYKMSVDAGASFASYENDSVVLTVGEDATLDTRLDLKGVQQTVMVTTETAQIETTKTEVSQTVGQQRIDNLPERALMKVRQRLARSVCAASSMLGDTPSTTPMRTRKAMGVNEKICAVSTPCRP